MRLFRPPIPLPLALAAALLCGCQGGGPAGTTLPMSVPASTRADSVKQLQGKTLLYAVTLDWNTGTGSIDVYNAYSNNPQPLKTLALPQGFSEGLWTDSHGNVYVAVVNAGPTGLGYIAKYTPGLGKLLQTYTAGLSGPTGGAFDSAGNMYVTNLCSPLAISCSVFARTRQGSNASYGYIGFYPPGATSPTKKIQSDVLTGPVGIALDRSGNLFAANNTGGAAWDVVDLLRGSYKSHVVQFTKVPSQRWVGAVTFDSKGALVASVNDVIDFFPHVHGAPGRTLSNGVLSADGLVYGPDGTLFAGNYEFEQNEGNVVAFPPGANAPARSYAVPYNQGVTGTTVGPAVSP